jgi:hypothetical protein
MAAVYYGNKAGCSTDYFAGTTRNVMSAPKKAVEREESRHLSRFAFNGSAIIQKIHPVQSWD